ncbi:MAG: DUF5343 domain-containing protein [Acidobacteriaceae bacterium]
MAESEARKTYPTMPSSLWWALRKKFSQSIPGVVTDSYLATVTGMALISARTNVLPALKSFGLIDQDGKPLERIKLWRDDESYPEVCKAIVRDIYPDELIHAVPNPRAERAKVEKWFAQKGGVGKNAAGKIAAMYTILTEADATKQPDGERKLGGQKKDSTRSESRTRNVSATKDHEAIDDQSKTPKGPEKGNAQNESDSVARKQGPDVNINLQIHISADSSSDQIDQIFASMAKHLYKNG